MALFFCFADVAMPTASLALTSKAHSKTSSTSESSVMIVLLPGPLELAAETAEETDARLDVDAEDSDGICLTDLLPKSALGLPGGAAMLRGSNLDLFSGPLTSVVEGLFFESREAMSKLGKWNLEFYSEVNSVRVREQVTIRQDPSEADQMNLNQDPNSE